MSKGSDHQIATETRRWSGAMQLPPGKPQILRRSLDQPGNVAFELGAVCTTRSVVAIAAATGLRRVAATVSFLNPQPALGIFATEQASSGRGTEAVVRLGAAG